MHVSENDIELIRYIQKMHNVSLHELSERFQRNTITLRRSIESINLYSMSPIITIYNSICSTKMSYQDMSIFIQNIPLSEYRSTQTERMNVFLVMAFFNTFVNTSKLYESWNLSSTTRKNDMASLRTYLSRHDLELVSVRSKGLRIVGNELTIRLLVNNVLHTLFDITYDKRIVERVTNTPIESQCYQCINQLLPYADSSLQLIQNFLDNYNIKITGLSEKFIFLFVAITTWRPFELDPNFVNNLPLKPSNLFFLDNKNQNDVYNLVIILLEYSKHLDFPFNETLMNLTLDFIDRINNSLTDTIYTKEELYEECYAFFYRNILMEHLNVELPDRLVHEMDESLSVLFGIITKYIPGIEEAYDLKFDDHQYSTLTFIFQKMIIRNRILIHAKQDRKKVIIVSNTTYERIEYFIAQVQEIFEIEFITMLNLNQREIANEMEYDYIFCLSERIYNILKLEGYPVLQLNYFVTPKDIEKLIMYDFKQLRTKFVAKQLVDEIHGMSKTEMLRYLRDKYSNYFI